MAAAGLAHVDGQLCPRRSWHVFPHRVVDALGGIRSGPIGTVDLPDEPNSFRNYPEGWGPRGAPVSSAIQRR